MERYRKLRSIIIILLVLFGLDIILMVLMIPARTFLTWAVAGTQAVVAIYFAALSLGLVKEAEERDTEDR